MDRRLAVSLVLTVVVLALSFAWLLGGGTGTVDDTRQSTTPATTEAGPSLLNTTVEGFDGRAVRKHRAVLERTGYAVVYRENRSGERPVVQRARSSLRQERITVRLERGNRSVVRYVENGTLYERREADGEVRYVRRTNVTGAAGFASVHNDGIGWQYLGQFQRLGNYSRAGNVTRDGERYRYYTVDGLAPTASGTGDLRGIDGTALVDRRGVVRRATIHATVERNGTVRTTNLSYRVAAVGDVGVQRPDWLDEARAAT